MLRNLLIFTALFFLSSCSFLSRSNIINHDRENEVISLIWVKIIYEGKQENRDHGFTGFCQLRFHDDNIDVVKSRRENDDPYYLLKTEPGKIMADQLSCMHHKIPLFYLKHRRFDMTEWAFLAHRGYINYLGHVTITYKPSDFGFSDLFGLGGVKYDTKGKVDLRVEDRADEALNFMNQNYPELSGIPLTKSFVEDITKIKPDTKPEAYVPGALKKEETSKIENNPAPPTPAPASAPAPVSTVTPAATKTPRKPNPYYIPYQSETTPYYNPYQKQESGQQPVQ